MVAADREDSPDSMQQPMTDQEALALNMAMSACGVTLSGPRLAMSTLRLRMDAHGAGAEEFEERLASSFCPVMPCDVFGRLTRRDFEGSRGEAERLLGECIQGLTSNFALETTVESVHRHLVHSLLNAQQCLGLELSWLTKWPSIDAWEDRGPGGQAAPYVYAQDDLVHQYTCRIAESPGTLCAARHLGPTRACRSGIVTKLHRLVPVAGEWRGQQLPNIFEFSDRQLRAWSTLTCIVTLGMFGKALKIKTLAEWCQVMLDNPDQLVIDLMQG